MTSIAGGPRKFKSWEYDIYLFRYKGLCSLQVISRFTIDFSLRYLYILCIFLYYSESSNVWWHDSDAISLLIYIIYEYEILKKVDYNQSFMINPYMRISRMWITTNHRKNRIWLGYHHLTKHLNFFIELLESIHILKFILRWITTNHHEHRIFTYDKVSHIIQRRSFHTCIRNHWIHEIKWGWISCVFNKMGSPWITSLK